MNAEDISMNDQFSSVVSFSAMQWVTNQEKAIAGIYRALKPTGRFLMMIPAGYPPALQHAIDEMMVEQKWQPYFKAFVPGQVFYSKEQYEAMLQKHGFTDIIVQLTPAHDRFDNLEAFNRFVRQWLPHLSPIPAEMRDSFMTELMDRYAKHQGHEADGSIWFTKSSLEAIAKKS